MHTDVGERVAEIPSSSKFGYIIPDSYILYKRLEKREFKQAVNQDL